MKAPTPTIDNLHKIPELKEIVINDATLLRPLRYADASEVLAILEKDTSIRSRVTVASRLFTEDDVANEVDEYKDDVGLIRYSILYNNKVVGIISFWRDDGFFDTPPNNDDYGFGYFLDPDYRGKGIITDCLTGLMNVAKDAMYVQQFVAFCEDDNIGSVAVLKRIGFSPTEQTHIEPNNGWVERKYNKAVASSVLKAA